jgi:hypothetical protein
MYAAYEIYVRAIDKARRSASKKVEKRVIGTPSLTFRGYPELFGWDARLKDWNRKKDDRTRAAMDEESVQKFTAKIAAAQSAIERIASTVLKGAEIAATLQVSQINLIAKKGLDSRNKPIALSRADLAAVDTLTRGLKTTTEITSMAKIEITDALGLAELIDDRNKNAA